jgi:uncharacterized membrane protein YesL
MAQLSAPFQVILQTLRDWWDEWLNMLVVGMAWFLCWMTVLLGPPATLGLYHVTHALAHGESLGLSGLLAGGRRYFLKGWLWALVNLAASILLLANFVFYGQFDAVWGGLLQGLFAGMGALWWVVQFYALPYLMEQEQQQLRLALRNGLLTVLASPGYTLVIVGVAALISVLSLVLVLPVFLGAPGLVALLGTRAVLERIETFGVHDRDA